MIKKVLTVIIIYILNTGVSYSQIKIGVALPLMNNSENLEEKKLGEQMLMGINDALDEYNTVDSLKKIILRIEDTKKDPATTLNIFNKFGSDSSVIAIYGPIFSSELANNAGAATFHKIPIITPTATQNFLAEKNAYVFQLNPTYDIRGRLMANFSNKELKMNNFAVLAEENYGINFANSFTDEIKKNGGNIIFTEYYSKDKTDLTEELLKLKNKIVEKERFLDFGNMNKSQIEKLKKVKLRFSYLDSLIDGKLNVSIYKLFGKNADKIVDSLGIIPSPYIEKFQDYIFGYVDAVYIPISSSNEISKIISQYFSQRINLPVLGTSDWNNEKALDENRMYIKELYFDSDFFLKDKSKNDFPNLNESEIKNYYFGYDGMKLILDKISEGNNTRQSLNEALNTVSYYKANHNDFVIKDRTNHNMSMMLFKSGELKKLKDYVY